MLSLLPALLPMGDLGASIGVGQVAPMATDFFVFDGLIGPQLELGYQHRLTPGLQLRLSWRIVADLDTRSSGVGVGLGLALPAQLMLGGQLRMDSQRWEPQPGSCEGRDCAFPKRPELSAAGTLTRASAVSERLVLEYGIHGAAGVISWSGEGPEVASVYRSASAQLWFWPNRA